jgi:hypothetical protein
MRAVQFLRINGDGILTRIIYESLTLVHIFQHPIELSQEKCLLFVKPNIHHHHSYQEIIKLTCIISILEGNIHLFNQNFHWNKYWILFTLIFPYYCHFQYVFYDIFIFKFAIYIISKRCHPIIRHL